MTSGKLAVRACIFGTFNIEPTTMVGLTTSFFPALLFLAYTVEALSPVTSLSGRNRGASAERNALAATSSTRREDINTCCAGGVSRSAFLTTVAAVTVYFPPVAHAFRGGTGAGGLGKTKPETGVVFFNEASKPTQQRNGDVFAELVVDAGKTPVLVSYNSPWPLLETSGGMETRNLQEPESAFVQVVDGSSVGNKNNKLSKEFFSTTVFSSQGKYGAYGAPYDIAITPIVSDQLYKVSFTSLTPAMRESERRVYIATRRMGDSIVMLVTGSTAPRFNKKEEQLRQVAESFQVTASPKTSLIKG